MNQTLKRAFSGLLYVFIMWISAISSELSCRLVFAFLAIFSIYEMWKLREGKSKFLAFLYIIIPFVLIQFLLSTNIQNDWNSNLILYMFILTWTFDTFAFIFGVNFGRHKILPSVSPNKSWEGFTGGFLFTILSAYIITYFLVLNLQIVIIMSFLIPFTATLGDFIESYYKRQAGVKDSGKLIPGHGGILDRMDAFMITIPVIYILTTLL
jgi:phosphatidate cytidylyltransferase